MSVGHVNILAATEEFEKFAVEYGKHHNNFTSVTLDTEDFGKPPSFCSRSRVNPVNLEFLCFVNYSNSESMKDHCWAFSCPRMCCKPLSLIISKISKYQNSLFSPEEIV